MSARGNMPMCRSGSATSIQSVANVSGKGRHLVVTGPIGGTTADELLHIRVAVTQRTTGTAAEGQTFPRG